LLNDPPADGWRGSTTRASDPAAIENRINSHPMVASCMVVGVGQAAAYAAVVLADDARLKLGDLAMRATCAARGDLVI
jgi:acyl-coenzyme A synthetase/AMP-(fatty) acid ligase